MKSINTDDPRFTGLSFPCIGYMVMGWEILKINILGYDCSEGATIKTLLCKDPATQEKFRCGSERVFLSKQEAVESLRLECIQAIAFLRREAEELTKLKETQMAELQRKLAELSN